MGLSTTLRLSLQLGKQAIPTSTLIVPLAVRRSRGSTHVKLQFAHPPSCPNETWSPNQPVMVTNSVTTSNQGYVSTYGQGVPTVAQINYMAGTGTPAGGSYQWSSTASGISFDNNQASSVHITASNYTGGTNDTPITLNYTYDNPAPPMVKGSLNANSQVWASTLLLDLSATRRSPQTLASWIARTLASEGSTFAITR